MLKMGDLELKLMAYENVMERISRVEEPEARRFFLNRLLQAIRSDSFLYTIANRCLNCADYKKLERIGALELTVMNKIDHYRDEMFDRIGLFDKVRFALKKIPGQCIDSVYGEMINTARYLLNVGRMNATNGKNNDGKNVYFWA